MIIVFDGTFDGLLTSIHAGMKGCRPNAVRSEEHVEAGLFDELIATVTDPDISLRVANGWERERYSNAS